jgi:hypothetical protein
MSWTREKENRRIALIQIFRKKLIDQGFAGAEHPLVVMAGLVPAIHAAPPALQALECRGNCGAWMPGTRPGMTTEGGANLTPVKSKPPPVV